MLRKAMQAGGMPVLRSFSEGGVYAAEGKKLIDKAMFFAKLKI